MFRQILSPAFDMYMVNLSVQHVLAIPWRRLTGVLATEVRDRLNEIFVIICLSRFLCTPRVQDDLFSRASAFHPHPWCPHRLGWVFRIFFSSANHVGKTVMMWMDGHSLFQALDNLSQTHTQRNIQSKTTKRAGVLQFFCPHLSHFPADLAPDTSVITKVWAHSSGSACTVLWHGEECCSFLLL